MLLDYPCLLGEHIIRSPSPLVYLDHSRALESIDKFLEAEVSQETVESIQEIAKQDKENKKKVFSTDCFTIEKNEYGTPIEVIATKDFSVQAIKNENRSYFIPAGSRFDLTRHGKNVVDFALMYEPARIRELIDKGILMINSSDENGKTPLMVSLHYGHIENARIMIERGANVNSVTSFNWTPLMYAIRYSTTENAQLLIKKGAEINIKNNSDWTPLMFALRYDMPDIAKLLIEKGADIHAKDNKHWTPLMFALRYDKPEIAKLLLEKGAEINIKNDDRWTPLLHACRYSTPEVVEIIAKRTKDIGAETGNGNSALHLALYNDNTANIGEIIRILKDNGADLNKENDDDLTAHGLAVKLDMPQDILNLLQ